MAIILGANGPQRVNPLTSGMATTSGAVTNFAQPSPDSSRFSGPDRHGDGSDTHPDFGSGFQTALGHVRGLIDAHMGAPTGFPGLPAGLPGFRGMGAPPAPGFAMPLNPAAGGPSGVMTMRPSAAFPFGRTVGQSPNLY